MKKYIELLKNFGFLTISNFGSKFLAFLLVPLYTSILTTEEYGNYDFVYTTISLLVPLLTIDISGAALRFLLDKKSNKQSIITYTFFVNIISIIIVSIVVLLNLKFHFNKIIYDYSLCFVIYYISFLLYNTLQNIARGLDKLKDISIVGFINSILILLLNILFLLYFKMGLTGYFYAYIISNIVSCIYLVVSCRVLKYISFKARDKQNEMKMKKYSFPLMLNSIGWWINNASDRYMVIYMVSLSANGLYSLAYKIPSLLTIIQSIFNQAWTISAVKTYNDSSTNDYYRNIYSIYNFVLILSCSLLIIFTKISALVLYKKDFYAAWAFMPPLMISNLFGALSGVLGGIFAATKDSKTMGSTTIIGAIINIVINFIFIKMIGTMGAAIGTLVSFFIVWLIRYIKISKSMKITKNVYIDIICYIIIVVQSILFYISINKYLLYSIESFLFLLIIILNVQLIKENKSRVIKSIKERKKKNE